MLKFKDFLLNEDLGIGPEGTANNPSIKNYLDSLRKEKKDLVQQKKLTVNNPEEKERLSDLLNQKQQEIYQTQILSNPQTSTTTPSLPTPQLSPSLGSPAGKESAFDKLIKGKTVSTIGSSSPTPSLASPALSTATPSPESSIYSGYKVFNNLISSITNPQLDIEVLGKTSKNIRL
jgi:hypothetical protein